MMKQPSDTLFVGSSELAGLMRATNWGQTAVGEPETWPQSVRAVVRLMLTSRYAMWMGWGPDLTFFYNDAYAEMTLGKKHPWALGKPASQVWAEIWDAVGPRIDHVLATGEATWDEGLLLFLERSGYSEETYHTFSYSPLHQDDGRIAGMFCVVTEETHRLIGQRRLGLLRVLGAELASSQKTDDVWRALERALGRDAQDLPFTLSYLLEADGTAALVASSGVAAGDPVAPLTIAADDPDWGLHHALADDAPPFTLLTRTASEAWPTGPWAQPPSQALVVPIAQPGQSRPAGAFIAGLNPNRPLDAEFQSFISLFVGQLSAALTNAQAYVNERLRAEALAQIDRAKTAFFSNVSHELRTPLTLILGPVADALRADTRALDEDALELVHRNALRLQKLVNALLDFSRFEAGRVEAGFEPIELGRYTAELASAFRSLIEGAGLQLVVEPPAADEIVYLDRDMWEKIVLNLLSNAFKFTLAGEIRVTVERRGSRMQLRVQDTGTGIPAPELPRIFERFHRVAGAVGRSYEGTGIGLALVQELVRLHGGTIEVASELGAGTTFIISVPLGSAHLPAARVRAPRRVSGTGSAADSFISEAAHWTGGGSGPERVEDPGDVAWAGDQPYLRDETTRLLLVDDNADMRGYLEHLLGRRWSVAVVADGREALTAARAQPPDLIITDVMMPHLDGFGLLQELRADERTRSIPVMMLSARAGEEARLEGIQAGADDYLAKPFSARELVAKVEAQLLRSRIRRIEEDTTRRIAAVFAQAPVPIAILRGEDLVFEMANDAYVALAGRRVLGQRVADAFPEVVGQGIVDLLQNVRTSRQPFVGRAVPMVLNRGPAGAPQSCYLDFVYQPLFDDEGTVNSIAVVAYEVTALVNAREAAEAADRTKDEFLAMLGHELRNPLAPILTALQLLRLRGLDGGERERTIIERQVRHLVGLVDDLLDVSRITRGKVRLEPESTELNEVVARAIEQASPLLEQHQHRFEADVPRQGLGVYADPARLAQVLANLLTNAAKYTPPGGLIRITAEADGAEVLIKVRDNGIGIEPEMLPRIFELFTQDRQAIDRAQGGLGLGLAIVRSLIALHHGTVTAHSDGAGRGSEFVVRLPRMPVDAAVAESRGRRPTPIPAAATPLRVLIVDDNEDAAEMLAAALAAAGHETAIAGDGPAALAVATTFRPDVALLDIGLPVMDGFELAHHFRSHDDPDLRRMPLVAVTGYGQDHDRRRSAAAGFDEHLVKPVDLDRLAVVIQQMAESD